MNNRVLPQRPNRLFLLKSWWKLFILAGGWAWRTMVVMGAPNFRGLFLLASSCWGPSLARKPWESRPTRYLSPLRWLCKNHWHSYPLPHLSPHLEIPTCFFPKAPWRPFWLPRSLFVGPRVGRGGAPLEQVWASETLHPLKPNDSLLVSCRNMARVVHMNSGALGNRKWRLRICAMSYNWRTQTLHRGIFWSLRPPFQRWKTSPALRWGG